MMDGVDFKKTIYKAIRKGHDRALVYNEYANCLIILNLNKSSEYKYSSRLVISDNGNALRAEDDWHEGIQFAVLMDDEFNPIYYVMVESWKE